MSKKILFIALISLYNFAVGASKAADDSVSTASPTRGGAASVLADPDATDFTHGYVTGALFFREYTEVTREAATLKEQLESLGVSRAKERDDAAELLRTREAEGARALREKESEVGRLNEQIERDSWNLRPRTVACVGGACAIGGALLAAAWGNREALREMLKGVKPVDVTPSSGN